MLIWDHDAENEFSDAAYYYDQQDEGVGDHFAGQIEAAVARILSNPFVGRCFDGECRKVKADRFPYLIIYLVDDGRVQIVSVMHTSRRPEYWKSRLKNL